MTVGEGAKEIARLCRNCILEFTILHARNARSRSAAPEL